MALEDADDPFISARKAMVLEQIRSRGVRDERVLDAMARVPRHRFLPEALWPEAYEDHPLPIGPGQTISQPYIVAFMAEALEMRGTERVLEIGSGSGYAAAALSRLAREVHGLELEATLVARSQKTLRDLGYANVHLHQGDGRLGLPQEAPFEAIVLSCSAPEIPEPLWEQLAADGRILLPLGRPGWGQELVLATQVGGQRRWRPLLTVAFVPLV